LSFRTSLRRFALMEQLRIADRSISDAKPT
jgi:hypothetical protein